jgi:hypothetical protein
MAMVTYFADFKILFNTSVSAISLSLRLTWNDITQNTSSNLYKPYEPLTKNVTNNHTSNTLLSKVQSIHKEGPGFQRELKAVTAKT